MKAAKSAFLRDGYAAVSTDQLCREAGVSKTTLYRYFGDMSGVLKAVVKREGDTFSFDDKPLPETEESYWLAMREYGVYLLRLLNTQFAIQLDRTMHEEARKHPDTVVLFYENAYGRSHKDLTRLMEHGKRAGFIRRPHSAVDLADYVICMWEGLAFVKTRLAMIDKPYAQPKRRVESVLKALFADHELPF
ncbi:MAG: TetR/AcrR family transcriptional regulator [Pseudomonadota bacterium]